jgi:uncharacterized membrane protein YphA (DoxX/SURF4 family)
MDVLFLVGRIVFGGFFLFNGANHFLNSKMMTAYAASQRVPAARVMVLMTGAMLLAGGASMVLGILPVVGAWLLVVFLVAAAVTMHAFWREHDESVRQAQMVQFLKNLALAGAALMISATDEWRWAIWANQWPVD